MGQPWYLSPWAMLLGGALVIGAVIWMIVSLVRQSRERGRESPSGHDHSHHHGHHHHHHRGHRHHSHADHGGHGQRDSDEKPGA